MKARVLIDTDIAIGEPNRDIDDALALVMAVNSPDLTIDSITLTYGNDSLENVLNSMGRLEGISSFPPLLSASGAESSQDLGKATAATGLLASQLEKDPATIVAIGPLTNIASLILLRPELTSRVTEVIAVAGRRPGQLFRTGEHPRSHPDLNFERDPEAFAVLLGSQIPVVLAPFEVSSKVWLGVSELEIIAKNNSTLSKYLEQEGQKWLSFWHKTFSTATYPINGFNPFDCLAIAWLTDRDLLEFSPATMRIEKDSYDTTDEIVQGTGSPDKLYLHAHFEASPEKQATYIYDLDQERFIERLLSRLK